MLLSSFYILCVYILCIFVVIMPEELIDFYGLYCVRQRRPHLVCLKRLSRKNLSVYVRV